jgi:hypothetical protein
MREIPGAKEYHIHPKQMEYMIVYTNFDWYRYPLRVYRADEVRARIEKYLALNLQEAQKQLSEALTEYHAQDKEISDDEIQF